MVYTNPEIAGVGETEESLQKRGIAYRAVKLPMAYSGRVVAENEGVNGVCKLLLGSDDTVLGAHVSVSYTHLDVYKRQGYVSRLAVL